MPVQKQTRAGQRTRFKAFVVAGDYSGHIGLGVKSAKEVAGAIRGALNIAKISIIPARKGFWGEKNWFSAYSANESNGKMRFNSPKVYSCT
mmetsp:Transcript_39721/g.93877  ORF Transcript_39721/g.93877 Transcript_39721/m.93877 type:complete len:91 (-) Transcript_39721:527-799(-)